MSTSTGPSSYISAELVNEKFDATMQMAQQSFSETQTFVDAMADMLTGLTPVPIVATYLAPDSPALREVTSEKPIAPVVEFPEFTFTAPDAPDNTFSFENSPYQSELMDALEDRLTDGARNGGTGLPAEVEAGIWNREKERAELELEEAGNRLAAATAASGFTLPDGAFLSGLLELHTKYQNDRLTTSRDIAAKQAELALKNTEIIYQQGNELERTKVGHFDTSEARRLEAEKTAPMIAAEIFKSEVERINVYVAAYNAIATKINGMAQIFKSQTELYVADASVAQEMNKSETERYKAEVEGAKADSETQIAALQLQINQIKQYLDLRMEAMKTMAAVQAQLTASALTSVSTSASIGDSSSRSDNTSSSTSASVSTSTNYNYSMSQ